VDTVAVSTDGTPSIATQSASSGYAAQVTVNGETYTAVEPQLEPEQQSAPAVVSNVPDLESVPTASPQAGDGWDTAPSCTSTPSQSNSVIDQSGRLWGWENSQVRSICCQLHNFHMWFLKHTCLFVQSCAYKAGPPYESAPRCGPVGVNGPQVTDSMGRLWGWENSASCVIEVSGATCVRIV
jgi:hypothetical protein